MTDLLPPASADIQRMEDELQALRAQLAARNSAFGERIEQQAATIDVLKAMSASPGDAQPVFDLIARQAAKLCNVPTAAVATFDGTMLHLATQSGFDAAYADAYVSQFPRPVGLDSTMGCAILNRRVEQVEDITIHPGHSFVGVLGHWSVMAVPILRDGVPLGAIAIGRSAMGPFSDSQIALLQTFAEQAAIAISSAKTYRALQTRTADLQESLESQTATSDVLKVISRTTFDLRPVLEAVVEAAAQLCDAEQAAIFRSEGDLHRLAANFGFPPEYATYNNAVGAYRPSARSVTGRAALEGRPVHVHDVAADPSYPVEAIRLGKQRTSMGVPLLREGEVIGTILLARQRVEPFTDRQIELVSTFADQAVIAIENTRLITEQREALEQQTATAEVLQVINASPANLAPVFDAMLQKATDLCAAAFGILWTFDGEDYHAVAFRNVPFAYSEFLRDPPPATPLTPLGRIAAGEAFAQIADMADEIFAAGGPMFNRAVELGGFRTIVGVPLRKHAVLLGAITIYRQEVRPFSDKQIALLQNFAAQAVIAVENARLITEQREALEQQTATAEVLQVINASPGDLAPVFNAMLEKAMRLCGAAFGSLYTYDGERFHSAAQRGVPAAYAELRERTPPSGRSGGPGTRILQTKCTVHILDMRLEEAYTSGQALALAGSPLAGVQALVELGGARTILGVPLLKDAEVLGYISIYRQEVRAFSEKQIALLENFAAQAVIAMENARLLAEQREALEQQTATAEVLRVINTSPGDLGVVFDAMLEKALTLCGAEHGSLGTYNGDYFRAVASRGYPAAVLETLQGGFHGLENPVTRPLFDGARFVQIPDLGEVDHPIPKAIAARGGFRTVLFVPLRKDGKLLGHISASRQEVRAFAEKEIALLENFAAQAVIAMENARLLTEQREALEQQTATAEVLQVINASPGNLTPVFGAILNKAHSLCGADLGALMTFDGEYFRAAVTHGFPEQHVEIVSRPFRPNSDHQKLIDGERLVHILDVKMIEIEPDDEVKLSTAKRTDVRTLLAVPLRKDDTLLGFISACRLEVRAFADREIALLENFAAQAVIAVENARLITEQREALEQQTATAEVLQVINTSPGNLAPVFDAVLEKAMRLCGGTIGGIFSFDGEYSVTSAVRGVTTEFEEYNDKYRMDKIEPGSLPARIRETGVPAQNPDVTTAEAYRAGHPYARALVELGGIRAVLAVPLLKDGVVVGMVAIYRQEVGTFSDKQISLLENFAAQAVIAMENARLLNEVRQRQEELRITFENMGDGVAMFDETPSLVAWNRKFQDILDLPNGVLAERLTFADYIRYLTERGEYGAGAEPEEQIRRLTGQAGDVRAYERTRPDGRVIEIRRNPVPSGGFVLIFSDISERKRNEAEIRTARDAAEEASRTIEAAYRELKAAQANLIQAEKMASLGQLTAGIAHEIKNPLNFVNNFAALSVDLLGELKEAAAPGFAGLTDAQRAEIDDVASMLTSNLEKITEHGQRADGIVKSMLEHSRGASGERRTIDLNTLVDETLNLAYHGARAQDQSFSITLERDFGERIRAIEVNPQDITRVFLNLFSNGFYAASRRARSDADTDFKPTLRVTTRDVGDTIEVRVRDNGTGIPADIKDKLFQPFFTTKPTGEGTGLGLSISYDIITQQHGGTITVDSEVGDYTEFVVTLPREMFASDGGSSPSDNKERRATAT